ncbi:MAG: helix-turn-helix domain-containing protein [Alphaproteobacteria bacterium]|nr:helix-turn-helix domain-containing protein [Alphaproteobacteria bacterium]
MPTGKQIKAARALLSWDAADLAEKASMRRETVLSVENGNAVPRPITMEKIIKAFNDAGVEFNGDRGVELRDDIVRKFEGEGYYLRFLDEVHSCMREKKGSVLFFNVDDSLSSQEIIQANTRMIEDGIKCRYLCKEKPDKLNHPVEFYRTVPEEHYRNGLLVVYDNYLAALARGKMMVVFKNADVADSVRKLFGLIWSQNKMPEAPNVPPTK